MKSNRGWFHTNNVYHYILLQLLWAFLALLTSQAVFYLCNIRIFQVDGFAEWMGILWGNIRFGLATVSVLMLPFIVMMLLPFPFRWRKGYLTAANILLLVPMSMGLIANLCDCAYFQFTYRRLSCEIFTYLTIGGDMGSLAPRFIIDYWHVSVSAMGILVFYLLFSLKTKLTDRTSLCSHTTNDLVGLGLGLVITFVFLRGGFGHTIQLSDAARLCQIKNSALVTNSPYSILRTSLAPDLDETQFLSSADARSLYNPDFDPLPITDSIATPIQKNVVIIMMESFSQEYMGAYNQNKEESFTPFLDSLARLGHSYDGRSNGKKSIEAVPAIFASLPTLMEKPVNLSHYKSNQMNGLPAILKQHGYHTAFFHGSYNGTMGFDLLCQKLGFEQYFGMDEYVKHHGTAAYDHVWGIFDEPFLQYTVEEMSQFRQPFMVGMFNISSHHPYTIPEEHKGEFKEGSHPLLQCVMYSDYALRRFFDACSRQPWYNNTLFVILGDHPGQGLTPEYNGYDGWYRIPMIFFEPGTLHPDTNTAPQHRQFPNNRGRIVQQIDVMPTLMDYLGINTPAVCFGSSLIRQPRNGWQVVYGNGYHALITQNPNNPSQHHVAAYEGNVTTGRQQDIDFLHAVIQTYNQRMSTNKLVRR